VDERAREGLLHRLTVLDALCRAQERREEVLAAVASSQDADEAAARILTVLDLDDEHAATAVLDRQVRSFTRQERERIEQTRQQVRTELEAP
jgi:DNA gyrase/topoisomerase IV subunit A